MCGQIVGSVTRPRVYCRKCKAVMYCDDSIRGTPPEVAKRKLEKIHKRSGCDGTIEYMAGWRLRGIPRGMTEN